MELKLKIQNSKGTFFMLLITMLSYMGYSQGCPGDQITADFYTKASGNFSNPSIWEYQNSCGNWIEATLPPGPQNKCTIRALDHSDLFSPQVINSLVVESGGSLVIISELTISGGSDGGGAGGSNSEIEISGNLTLTNFGQLHITRDEKDVIVHNGGSVTSLGEISLRGDMTVHGQYNGAAGKLTLDGSSAQVLDHSPDLGSPPSNFGELVLDNPSTVQVGGTGDIITEKTHTKTGHVTLLKRTTATQSFRVDSGGIVTTGPLVEVAVGGDMTVHGQYDGALGKLTFDGLSAQVLDHSPDLGSPPSNFGELVLDNPSTVQVGGTEDIITAKTHTKTGHVTLLKRTAATESFRVDSGGIFTTGPLVEVAVRGDMTVHGQYDGALGKLTFDGLSAQVLDHSPDLGSPPSNFGEVVILGNSFEGVTISGTGTDEFVCEKIEIKKRLTLNIDAVVRGHVNMDSTGDFVVTWSTSLFVGGDWTNNGGTFDPGTSTVIFNGTGVQKIEGVSSNFHNLTIDNPAGLELRESPSLPRLTTISGVLNLPNGKVYLFGGHDLELASTATIIGASPSSYIVTNGKGSLKRQLIIFVGGLDVQMVYPIGTESSYSPVTYQLFSTTGQPVVLGARVADGLSTAYDVDDNPIGNAILPRCVLKTYFATGEIPTGDYIKMKLQWSEADEGLDFDRTACDLGHYTGGQWVRSTPTIAVAENPSGSYSGSFNVTVTSLSPFAVFSQDSTSCSNVGEWTGIESSAWENPNNWCNGQLPTATTNVVIPSGRPNNPEITAGVIVGIVVGAVIADLRIESGASLRVSNNLELHVTGDMTVHGQYNGFDGKLVFDGASAQAFDHSPDATSPPSNFGELVFSNTAGGITVIGNTIPVLARESKSSSISEVVVTKEMDIAELVLINPGAKFTVTATGELSVGGEMIVHGQYDGALGKLTFDGTSAQVLDHSPLPGSPPSNFGELVLDNPSTVQVGGTEDIICSKTHTKTGHVTLLKRTAAAQSFLVDSGGIVTTGPLVEVAVGGDMTVHGQYDGALGKFSLNGSSAQLVVHSPAPGSPPSNFGELLFDNPTFEGVTVQGNDVPFVSEKKEFKGHVTLLKRTSARQNVVIDSSGNLYIPGEIEFSVGGDWINNGGVFNPGSSTVIINGSGNSIIGGSSSTQYFNNLKVNKSVETSSLQYQCQICHCRTITIQSGNLDAGSATDIFVSGDWINNGGTFTPSSCTVNFNGSEDSIIGGTSLNQKLGVVKVVKDLTGLGLKGVGLSLDLLDADNMILQSGELRAGTADISISGDWTNNGGTFIPAASTVSFYGGDGDSHIGGTATDQNFFNIRIRESPTLASTGQTKRTVCTGSTTSLHAHDIEISSLASFDSGTASLIEISGDLTNDGSFVANTGEVKIKNLCLILPCTRSVGSGIASISFHKLTIDNPEGFELRESPSLPKNTFVEGELEFISGKLFLVGVGDVILSEEATITSPSSLHHVVTNEQGALSRVIPLSNPSVSFPIGSTLGYSPVTVTFGNVTDSGSLKIKAGQLTPPQLITSGISTTNNVSTIFTVEKDVSLAFGDCSMTFSWDASLATGDTALYHVKTKIIGTSNWISANVIARTATSITIDGVTDFGEFVIGELGNSNVVNLKLFIEGYYIGGGIMTSVKNNQDYVSPTDEVEDIIVELHDAVSKALVATTTTMLHTDGTAVCGFPTAASGSYYIAIKTSNATQTWSATPQTVGAVPLDYDFTTATNRAYEDNMINLGDGVFGFYSGDINQDDVIDGSDSPELDLDIFNSEFGVRHTDLNGDGTVDGSDATYLENNSSNSVFAHYPS